MIEAGVPCVPGSVGILESFEQTQEIAKSFVIQSCLKQLQVVVEKECVWKEEDLLKAWEGARQESAAASVMTVCILEKLFHIEIQAIGDFMEKHVF
jgi:acetyl-CoA carboxylase biotin carboxylase subunit